MSAARLILRIIIATVIVITLGVIAIFGFQVIEPFYGAFGDPPASLGWGTPATKTLAFASFGFIGLFLVLIIWFVYAPIREDRRQQYRY
jgi:TRAP-type C4-dicarboxylate transport system permease small subunit